VHPIDQLTFMIGLSKHQAQAKTRTNFVTALLDLGERRVAVNVRLPLSEEVQVGSIQDMDAVQCLLQNDRGLWEPMACAEA
jgi:hypothetical protein